MILLPCRKGVTVCPGRTIDVSRELWKGKLGYYRPVTGSDRFFDRTCVRSLGTGKWIDPKDDPSSVQHDLFSNRTEHRSFHTPKHTSWEPEYLPINLLWHLFTFHSNRPSREETTDATRTVVATLSPSAAPTAPAASPRTRPSSATPSALWSSWLPSVISLRLLSTRSTPSPSSTSRSTTASPAPSTPTLSVFVPVRAVAAVLPHHASASRMARRSLPLRLPSLCKASAILLALASRKL